MRRVVVLGVVAAGCGGSDPTLTIVRAGTAAEGVVTSAAGLDCGDDCSVGARPRLVVEGAIAPPTDAAIIGSCRID